MTEPEMERAIAALKLHYQTAVRDGAELADISAGAERIMKEHNVTDPDDRADVHFFVADELNALLTALLTDEIAVLK